MYVLRLLSACGVVSAWYLPGSAPIEYEKGAQVQVKVNSLSSVKSQLPFNYYDLPFCRPEEIIDASENLGEILRGDKIQNTPYSVHMLEEKKCEVLCRKALDDADKKALADKIDEDYVVNLLADNFPAAARYSANEAGEADFLQLGYPVGYKDEFTVGDGATKHYINNHVTLILKYHFPESSGQHSSLRVVGFEIEPSSIPSTPGGEAVTCGVGPVLPLEDLNEIVFTYDVVWVESSVKWATRWDSYLSPLKEDADIHWFSILNSLIIVVFLSGILAMIMLRTLLKDIAMYNAVDDEAQEESGWKLVHADVFRRPSFGRLLSVCTGTGVQILGMTFATVAFSAMGILSPASRGALLQSMLIFFALMGIPAGYVAARFNKLLQKDEAPKSITVTFMTATLFPGICFAVFFFLNFLIWLKGSTGAVPFGTLLLLLVIWFGISLPAVYLGAFFGYKRPTISIPVRTHQIPREIPPAKCLNHPFITCLAGGLLPFVSVFAELILILDSIWQQQFYYLFGFLLIVIIILVVVCAEISITFTYFQLTSEDYKWWWRSFLFTGTSALYVFLFSCFFVTRMNLSSSLSVFLYFGYIFLLSYAFFLLTGGVGFIASFVFVRAIYGSIKVD